MIFLLNLLKENEKRFKDKLKVTQERPIDTFFQIINEKQLIPKEKLEKLINETDSPDKKR